MRGPSKVIVGKKIGETGLQNFCFILSSLRSQKKTSGSLVMQDATEEIIIVDLTLNFVCPIIFSLENS